MTELEALIRERIRIDGPLPFHEVMQAALYHPTHGYYTNLRGFGAAGDFITSPERHPAFGWLLARQALDVWEALARPRPFKILELGAGSGALAEPLVSVVRAAVPEVVYTLDETSPSLRAVQQGRLRDPAFRWHGIDEPAHFIIANEVADALPVDRVVVRGGALRELRVGLDADGALSWVVHAGVRPEIEAYFAGLHYLPPEGQVVDVCTDLADWVTSVARRLERGVALVLDYAASPPRDSLLTYYRHTMGSDPLVRLGQQDISAHVDLRTLVRLAIAEGLRAGATAQRALLFNLGLQQVQARLPGSTDRAALAGLVDPNALGGQIAAVFLVRGLPDYKPVGAVGRADWPEPAANEIPSLPIDHDEAEFLSQWHEAFPQS
ncbi:MAG TPA: SAM-dependent methyltransferase [Chloroflexota bacterium]|nr:SAM-dependent methyltransferase [Chloroflexota bacterium]